jgi:ribosomal protein S18 acetylase RimI-like enzyme
MSTVEQHDSILIRDARPDDLDNVSLLLRVAYQEYETAVPPDAWKAYLRDIMDVRSRLPESELIVAISGERLVGAVTFYGKGSRSLDWPEGWAGVRLLAVHPGYRGRGIGRCLMQECVRRCRDRGIKTIALHTTEVMEVARGMYERMGFARIPEHDFHPAPGVVVMAYRMLI